MREHAHMHPLWSVSTWARHMTGCHGPAGLHLQVVPCGPGQPGVAWAQVGTEVHVQAPGDTGGNRAGMASHGLHTAGLIETISAVELSPHCQLQQFALCTKRCNVM